MLNQENKIILIVLIILISISCRNRNQNIKETENRCYSLSTRTINKVEYKDIYNQATDSIKNWCLNRLLVYKELWSYDYKLDSLLCFNTTGNRFIGVLLIPCIEKGCSQDDIRFLYGAKVSGKWYFFSGATIVLPREYYQKDNHTPLSFEKLHEIAMKEVFGGYLKKSDKGEWEINDAFFTSQFEGLGWGDFNRQDKDSSLKGHRFTNQKDYYEYLYLEKVRNNWAWSK